MKKCWCGGSVQVAAFGEPMTDSVCLDSVNHDPFATGRPERITTLYVAGPMSGYPENNYPEFNRVAATLRDAGYTVVNPVDTNPPGRVHYVDLLREDLREMLSCHGVAVHGDWWDSSGARNEVAVAGLLKMPVRPWTEWLERSYLELSPLPHF